MLVKGEDPLEVSLLISTHCLKKQPTTFSESFFDFVSYIFVILEDRDIKLLSAFNHNYLTSLHFKSQQLKNKKKARGKS